MGLPRVRAHVHGLKVPARVRDRARGKKARVGTRVVATFLVPPFLWTTRDPYVLRKEVYSALNLLADALPSQWLAFYVRRATTAGAFLRLAGDTDRVTGWTVEEWMARGGTWRAQVHPDDVGRIETVLQGLDEGGERCLEYRFLDRDGRERWVMDSMRAIPGAPGGPWEVVGVLRDAALERTLRSQVAAAEDRSWESQRMESLGSLAGGVTHDFNNLLTTILSTIQLLEQDVATQSPATRRNLGKVREAAERGSGMVSQILRFAARREQAVAPVDVYQVVGDLEGILRRRLGPEIQLALQLGGDLPVILSDPAQLEQMILNLAANAREAMPEGGEVWVRTERRVLTESKLPDEGDLLPPGEYVCITVGGSGPGIADDVRGRMFEPFFTTKTDGEGGSGLGLATVLRVVRAHGGGIVLDNGPVGGGAFHVHFPVRHDSAHEVAPEAAPAVALRAPRSGVRVLAVEGDSSLRDPMKRALHQQGHTIAAVGTAADALRAFDSARPPFGVVIIDMVLPDRLGPSLARALRRRHPSVGLLVYASGYREYRGVDRYLGCFLSEPFTSAELGDAVQGALSLVATRVPRSRALPAEADRA